MMKLPVKQVKHKNIDLKSWLALHFPQDSSYRGRVFVGRRYRSTNGIYDLTRRNIDELEEYISQMHVSRNMDYYIMANSVSGVRRRNRDVFALHNIVIDIDCHGEDAVASPLELAQSFVWLCSRDLWTTGLMPEPNSIVYTGRGVQFWWAIDPISVKLAWIYFRILNWLMDQLEELLEENASRLQGLEIDRGASRKLCGWFRLPLTYNTKAKRWGTLQIRCTERYNHQYFLDCVIPKNYRPKIEKQSETLPAASRTILQYEPIGEHDAAVIKGGTTAMALRVLQMEQLRKHRKNTKQDEMRDRFCFVVYCALLADYDETEAWRRLVLFNLGFTDKYDLQDLEQKMSTATKLKYKLTNEWLIAELRITEEEQRMIGLYPTGAVREKKSPNFTRDLIRSVAKNDRNRKILEMYANGARKAEIARELEISRTTVISVIKDAEAQQEALEAALEAELEEARLEAAAGAEEYTEPQNAPDGKVYKNGSNKYVSYAQGASMQCGQDVRSSGKGPPGSGG